MSFANILEPGDSPDTAAFNALNPVRKRSRPGTPCVCGHVKHDHSHTGKCDAQHTLPEHPICGCYRFRNN